MTALKHPFIDFRNSQLSTIKVKKFPLSNAKVKEDRGGFIQVMKQHYYSARLVGATEIATACQIPLKKLILMSSWITKTFAPIKNRYRVQRLVFHVRYAEIIAAPVMRKFLNLFKNSLSEFMTNVEIWKAINCTPY